MTDERLNALVEAGKDVVQKADGSLVETAQLRADYCIISYIDCTSKKTELISLNNGDTFYYGDWDGKKCVRKEYKCK